MRYEHFIPAIAFFMLMRERIDLILQPCNLYIIRYMLVYAVFYNKDNNFY